MKKAMVVLVSMMLITLISVASLSAAFVYPGGSVRYYARNILKDKTTTKLIFNGQPDEAGTYGYRITATVMGVSAKNNAVPLKTTEKKVSGGIKYFTTSRTFTISAECHDGVYGKGIVSVNTATHGNYGNYWYAS